MARQKFFDTEIKPERAVLVGLITAGETEKQEQEYLEELAFLVCNELLISAESHLVPPSPFRRGGWG